MPSPSQMRVRRCSEVMNMPVRKGEAARFLGVHRNTVTKWACVAKQKIPNYRTHFEQSGSSDKAPLSPYRFWVLTRLKEVFRIYRDEFLVEKYIEAHPYDFSFRAFFELRKQEKQAS